MQGSSTGAQGPPELPSKGIPVDDDKALV